MRERMTGSNNHNFGKPKSDEIKRKMSESHKKRFKKLMEDRNVSSI